MGVDLEHGPHVDEICDGGALRERFGDESFDVVVTTEMLEHARDWRGVVSNLKHVVKSGGTLLITTRSHGFPYHAWPGDYWRYERSDMREIFADFTVDVLESDPEAPGVFLKATRPSEFHERDLSAFELFSMVKQRRAREITPRDERLFSVIYAPVRLVRSLVPHSWKRALKRTPLSRENRIQARHARRATPDHEA
jgi:SAM-dependent methyltransferase